MSGDAIQVDGGRRGFRWYEILYILALVAILGISIYFLNPHRVGVLDLPRVARSLGVAERMNTDDRAFQEDAFDRMTKLQKEKAPRINELSRKAKNATGSEKSLLEANFEEAQNELQLQINTIKGEAQRHQNQMVVTFRKRLQPHVEAIARKKKMDVILDPNAGVIYARSPIDVTDLVIAAARDSFPAGLPLIDPALVPPAPKGGDAADAPLAAPVRPAKKTKK